MLASNMDANTLLRAGNIENLIKNYCIRKEKFNTHQSRSTCELLKTCHQLWSWHRWNCQIRKVFENHLTRRNHSSICSEFESKNWGKPFKFNDFEWKTIQNPLHIPGWKDCVWNHKVDIAENDRCRSCWILISPKVEMCVWKLCQCILHRRGLTKFFLELQYLPFWMTLGRDELTLNHGNLQ